MDVDVIGSVFRYGWFVEVCVGRCVGIGCVHSLEILLRCWVGVLFGFDEIMKS